MNTSPALEIGITRDIYPMPAFITLTTSDLSASTQWYEAVGFINLFAMPGPDGSPALVHLRRWRYQDVLLVPGQPGPGIGSVLSIAAEARELAGIAEAAAALTLGTAGTPTPTAWNTIDLHLTDPDGYKLTFTARAPEQDRDESFDQWMAEQS
ncbi:MAG: VOC family protein [Ornithinimicrobium sp.]